MSASETIVVTGATGQLGRLVLAELLRIAPGARLVGAVRKPATAKDLADRGVEIRAADYNNHASWTAAFTGADKVLLISSNEVGHRVAQHRNVIDAAKTAGVKLLAYTSILRADTSPMALAVEHLETEKYIRASGVPFVFLRNGWYTENYTVSIGAALQHGAVLGAARNGRISSAARADFAAAAAVVMASDAKSQAGRIYELAGDSGFTLSEYAAEISRQSGKPVLYQDMARSDYKVALQGIGLPEPFAELYSESDAKAAGDSLYDAGRELSKLIGRPTTTLAASVTAALAAAR
ncbi:MAG: SDR family oxidoreductase [Gammaproteobacteria bacterium]